MKKFVAARITVSAVLIGIILTVIAIQSNRTQQISPPPSPPVVQDPISPIVKNVAPPPLPVVVEVLPSPIVEEAPVENAPVSSTTPTLDELERQVTELERRFKTTTSDFKAKQSALDALGDE